MIQINPTWSDPKKAVSRSKLRRQKRKQLIVKIVRRITLPIVLLAYTLIGGVLFYHIEGPNEKRNIKKTMEEFRRLMFDICNMASQNFSGNITLCMEQVSGIMWENEDKLKKLARYGMGNDNGRLHWTYMGSVFFSSTVYTAIGKLPIFNIFFQPKSKIL